MKRIKSMLRIGEILILLLLIVGATQCFGFKANIYGSLIVDTVDVSEYPNEYKYRVGVKSYMAEASTLCQIQIDFYTDTMYMPGDTLYVVPGKLIALSLK